MTALKTWAPLMRRHPALLLTTAYLGVSLIGMFFSWAFFRRFEVNYFLFADITDFLLAAAREPLSLVAGAGGAVLVWLLFRYSSWDLDRLERRGSRGWLLQRYIALSRAVMSGGWVLAAVLLYVYTVVSWYAGWQSDRIRAGQGAEVIVRIADDPPVTRLLIGSSARFLFFYDTETGTTIVVANENVVELRSAPPTTTPPAVDDPPAAAEEEGV